MKYIKSLLAIAIFTFVFSGCATVQAPVRGGLYTQVKAPLAATSNSGSSKVGSAEASSILGLIATGDASIRTAAKSAGISEIHHVDYESTSILGLYSTFTVYVYGE